ncbi:MAG: hypothetical protein LBO03_06155 [Acidaminococcales bacterium]|jgi:hypothetical protein|nr:hypothetical protein [Acidaminococcales bacterium]
MQKDPTVSFNDPKMLAILKEINQLKEEMSAADAEAAAALKKQINELQMHYNVLSERRGPV